VASRHRRVVNKLLAIIVGAATAILAITLVALDVLLPLSTVTFVLAATGASAIAVARVIKYLVYRQ
jgi:hypothetical protein